MSIQVKVPTALLQYAGGATKIECQGANVLEVLQDLGDGHPGALSAILADDGAVLPHISLFLDEERIQTGDLQTETAGAKELTILLAVAGG